MSSDPKSLQDILDRLIESSRERDNITVDRIVETFGHRSYGPVLIVPALIELTPVGAIPGVPTVLALVVLLFAVQIIAGRRHLWMPRVIASRSISANGLRTASKKARPAARWTDRWFHGRMPAMTRAPFVQVAAAICALLTVTVPPLELVPFASSGPLLAIALFGLALLVRDGLLMLVALAIAFLGVGAGLWLLTGG
ncbi:MAG: exopolysaccharide biosynthesis protein [Rhizobiaceae bacterium]|nr:exopolysaccharide biosynthesis protein [Rhizobiaceae bacterium]MCV0404745.1 exopolysaccharide biosynthesis protein [Rhizobiaceae bacterium]